MKYVVILTLPGIARRPDQVIERLVRDSVQAYLLEVRETDEWRMAEGKIKAEVIGVGKET